MMWKGGLARASSRGGLDRVLLAVLVAGSSTCGGDTGPNPTDASSMAAVSGGGQKAPVGAVLPESPVVLVTDQAGAPMSGSGPPREGAAWRRRWTPPGWMDTRRRGAPWDRSPGRRPRRRRPAAGDGALTITASATPPLRRRAITCCSFSTAMGSRRTEKCSDTVEPTARGTWPGARGRRRAAARRTPVLARSLIPECGWMHRMLMAVRQDVMGPVE